jgi:hypothetical protein
MPRKKKKKRLPEGEESRLSKEGLAGTIIDGKQVATIVAHGEARRERTIFFTDGSFVDRPIYNLIGYLIESRNGGKG